MDEAADSGTEGSGGIQSLDSALRLLLAMSRMSGPASLTDLARQCSMPVSKAHRYLASFLHAGLVRQNGRSGKYDLGPASAEIGLAALARHDFVNRTADELPALAMETGLTALLAVWGNAGPTIVRWERAASLVVASLGLGTTLPLLTSATGRVFLAHLPESLTGGLLRRELERAKESRHLVDDVAADPDGIETVRRTVRNAGYATVDGRYIPGLVAASAPILDWQGQAQAAVTLVGTSSDIVSPGSPVVERLVTFCRAHSLPRGT